MDLVLRLADDSELPDGHHWMLLEQDGCRALAVVARDIPADDLCALWRLINPPDEDISGKAAVG